MANHTPDYLGHHLRTLPIHRVLARSIEAHLVWELNEELIGPIRAAAMCARHTHAARTRSSPKPASTDHTAG